MSRITSLLCVLGILLGACGSGGGDMAEEGPIRVFAASSLTDVLPEIAEVYSLTGQPVELVFGGSGTLREQILDGADADVFISANQSVMVALVDADLVDGDPHFIARNSLSIVVPVDNPGAVRDLADLENTQLVVGLCAVGVPCGDLAAAVLAEAGTVASVDTYEQNVRALLAKVELGELDAALVYRTDARASDEVVEIAIPSSQSTVYLAAALYGDGAEATIEARQFVSFLRTPIAEGMFVDAGFATP